jgi:ABC-2 type transport system permease protein
MTTTTAERSIALPPLGINWIGMWGIVRREMTDAMRHPTQLVLAPWVSALIFIFVFGYVLGHRMPAIAGVPYLKFLLPGLVMMDVVTVSFTQTSGDLYFARFQRYVQEMLVSPLSYFEMMMGSLVVAILRAFVTAVGVLVMGWAFGGLSIVSFAGFVFWIGSVAVVFALAGMIVGLWADNFEQLGAVPIFFLSPLSMVGGVFTTVAMLPDWLRFLAYANPFFYFINGLRHAMIGFNDSPPVLGVAFALLLVTLMGAIVWRLFATGWGLRD